MHKLVEKAVLFAARVGEAPLEATESVRILHKVPEKTVLFELLTG